ncbi:hypothetical protein AMECASPLE_015201 [Ameca splendens]|uniref:Uncharacterized protein n=1 Tax=Ameca splendens TaxID=208324 RepID=A0ABV0XQQ8_9TELE
MNNLPTAHGHTPQVSFIPKKLTKQHLHSTSSTHSPAPITPHTAHRDSKARALRNAAPATTHRRNRADTVEHRAHNRTPNPTARWDKLTQQEVPSQWQALVDGVPYHASATTQTNHITATATIAQVETLSGSALPLPLSPSRCR